MTRDTINQKLIEKIKGIGGKQGTEIKDQSIRDGTSRLKKKNFGITSNAAAYKWAEEKGINVYRYLSDQDKKSLQHLTSKPVASGGHTKSYKIKKKKVEAPYGTKFVTHANQNAEIYPYVFILENSLRALILKKFKDEGNWWNNKKFVKDEVRDYAKKIQQAEQQHKWIGTRGSHPIFYVNLEHLLKIISRNYNPYFRELFDLQKFQTWVEECIPIRNLVAHNIPAQKEERDNIRIKTKYICNLIKDEL